MYGFFDSSTIVSRTAKGVVGGLIGGSVSTIFGMMAEMPVWGYVLVGVAGTAACASIGFFGNPPCESSSGGGYDEETARINCITQSRQADWNAGLG